MRLRLRNHRLHGQRRDWGRRALAQFRERLAQRHIKLMLDFVPNHTAPDHPWAKSSPDHYVQGSAASTFQWPKHARGDHFPVGRPALLASGPVRGRAGESASALVRGPIEPIDQDVAAFYARLLQILKDTDAFRNGDWSHIDPLPAWPARGLRFLRLGWTGRRPLRRAHELRGELRAMLSAPAVPRASGEAAASHGSNGQRSLAS